jgi:uncharacterized membrane-anchored protein YhcB (DUF1043 family)
VGIWSRLKEIAMDMAFVGYLLALVVGFGLGCWFYRYTLKKDPEQLEQWAAEIKAQRRRIKP